MYLISEDFKLKGIYDKDIYRTLSTIHGSDSSEIILLWLKMTYIFTVGKYYLVHNVYAQQTPSRALYLPLFKGASIFLERVRYSKNSIKDFLRTESGLVSLTNSKISRQDYLIFWQSVGHINLGGLRSF